MLWVSKSTPQATKSMELCRTQFPGILTRRENPLCRTRSLIRRSRPRSSPRFPDFREGKKSRKSFRLDSEQSS